jgi:hypothetical protein
LGKTLAAGESLGQEPARKEDEKVMIAGSITPLANVTRRNAF